MITDDKNLSEFASLKNVPKELSEKNPKELQEYARAQSDFMEAKNPKEKLAALEKLKTMNNSLDIVRRKSMNIENLGTT